VRIDEVVDRVEVVDARGVLEVRRVGVLMAVAEVHQRLVGPRVVVEHGEVDDSGVPRVLGDVRLGGDVLEFRYHGVRLNHVRVELHHVGGVRRGDFVDAVDVPFPNLLGDGHRTEVGVETHRLVEFDEDVVVCAVLVARFR
jgi:hypothetical protein